MTDLIEELTPETVVAAYRKTGYKALRGEYYIEEKHACCGLGVYALSEQPIERKPPTCNVDDWIDDVLTEYLDETYVTGFACGFDGKDSKIYTAAKYNGPEFKRGYADGVKAWEAVVASDIEIVAD